MQFRQAKPALIFYSEFFIMLRVSTISIRELFTAHITAKETCFHFIATHPHFDIIRGGGRERHTEPWRIVKSAAVGGAVHSIPQCTIVVTITEVVIGKEKELHQEHDQDYHKDGNIDCTDQYHDLHQKSKCAAEGIHEAH